MTLLITAINVLLSWGVLIMGIVALFHLCRYLSARTDMTDLELDKLENSDD